ncbi:unnamed protein product [Dimorphilus gyrociliatus]|uniref:Uncharacterized protein n=1 Tax=Dimorphilus gyrociliatus TaxID=2664684 RepID=A0A7I8W9U2_9ANNE|nr:unnamed protein product [Dimorphilus gyrociliatus]
MADLCPGLLWAVIWFFGLIFVGWPIGFLLAWLYVCLLPFGACIEAMKGAAEAVLGIVQLPLTFADNMVNMKPCGK